MKARAVCQYHSFISPHYFPCLRTQQDYMLVWPVILDSCWAVARQRGDVVSTRNESFVEVNRRRCPEMSVIGCCAEVLSMYKCNKLQSVSQEERIPFNMGSVHSVIIRYAVFSDLLFIYSKINRLLFGLFIYLYLTWVYRYFFKIRYTCYR